MRLNFGRLLPAQFRSNHQRSAPTTDNAERFLNTSSNSVGAFNATRISDHDSSRDLRQPSLTLSFQNDIRMALKNALLDWQNQGASGERRGEAAERILEAFDGHATSLDLGFMGLKSLPEAMGMLSALTELRLCGNDLCELPAAVGKLPKLKFLDMHLNQFSQFPRSLICSDTLETLDLSHNNLRQLPDNFGRLRCLSVLNLSDNRVTQVSQSISALTGLKELFLTHNQLQSLPDAMGRLTRLEWLDVASNDLRFLPSAMGDMQNLRMLEFGYNRHLNTLPITLGNIGGLPWLSVTGTGISPDDPILEAIYRSTRSARHQSVDHKLPHQLALWQSVADLKVWDASDCLTSFTRSTRQTISEWLTRLERCAEFRYAQKSLAKTVLNLLTEVARSPDFKEMFLAHAHANNTHCQDRAAMALNEIYTAWCLHRLPLRSAERFENGDDNRRYFSRDEIELISSLAKTYTLRSELQKIIEQHKSDKADALRESVEIFLYYEVILRDELGLVTAVEHEAYGAWMGHKSWIDVAQLKQAVIDNYLEKFVDLPIFDVRTQDEPRLQEKLKTIHERLSQQGGGASSTTGDPTGRALMKQYARETLAVKVQWLKGYLRTCEESASDGASGSGAATHVGSTGVGTARLI